MAGPGQGAVRVIEPTDGRAECADIRGTEVSDGDASLALDVATRVASYTGGAAVRSTRCGLPASAAMRSATGPAKRSATGPAKRSATGSAKRGAAESAKRGATGSAKRGTTRPAKRSATESVTS